MPDFPLKFAAETVDLLLERALFRPKTNSLYVADMHWGKVATLQALQGVPLPAGGLTADLGKLSTALARCGAERLVVLGDLVHSALSLSDAVLDTVLSWRRSHHSLHIDLIEGNHDRYIPHLPAELGINRLPEWVPDSGIWLTHEPLPELTADTPPHFCGHVHPGWRIQGRGRPSITLPCFAISGPQLLFPAFGHFTGRTTRLPHRPTAVYGIGENRIFQLVPSGL